MFRNVMVVLSLVLLVAAVVGLGWLLTRPPSEDEGNGGGRGPEEVLEVVDPGAIRAGRPGSITGEVRILATQEAAAGIEVEVTDGDDTVYVETDRAGRFSASGPAGVGLTIRVIAPEPYATLEIRGIARDPGRSTSLGTLYLEKAFLVRGIVVDPKGQGLGGALVSAHRPAGDASNPNILDIITSMGRKQVPLDEAVAADDGTFTLEGLSPGTYRLEAEAEGFAPGFLTGASVSPETAQHVFRIVVADGVGLSGTVKTAAGEPFPGALVTTMRLESRSFQNFDFRPVQETTDEDGRFHFKSLRPGQAGLMVSAEGYPLTIVERVDIGSEEEVEVVLGGTASVQGTVSDSDGEPIEGAEIMLAVGRSGASFARTMTDAKGEYRIEHLVVGEVQFFLVTKDGYPGFPSTVDMMGGMGRNFGKLEEGQTLTKDVTLERGAVVTGVVTDSSTGRAVAGAEVSLRSGGSMFGLGAAASAITGENGSYRIQGAGEGGHLMVVRAAGFVQQGITPQILQQMYMPPGTPAGPEQDGPVIRIGPGVTELKKNLTVAPGASIRGVVVDGNSRPVGGAQVSVTSGQNTFPGLGRLTGAGAGTALTNPDGEFRIDGAAAADKVKLRAHAEGFVEGFSEDVTVTVGAEVTGVTIRLGIGGTLSGTVVGADGRPLEGASVRAVALTPEERGRGVAPSWRLRQGEGVVTDETGTFDVTGLKPGPILVGVEAPDYRQLIVEDLSVAEDQVSGGHVFALEKGLEISGRVTDESGAAVEKCSLWVRRVQEPGAPPDFGGNNRAEIESDGSFRVAGLAPGTYVVSARASGYAPESMEGVAAGATGIELIMKEGLEISGLVLLPDGAPAGGASVQASREDGQASSGARAGEDGRFVIKNLKPGAYTITVSVFPSNRGNPDEPRPMNVRQTRMEGVAAGTRDIEIRLVPGVSIFGVVVNESGIPVAGARVFARPVVRENAPRGLGGTAGSGVSGEDGSFEVTGLAEGEYPVNAWAQGHGPAEGVKSPAPGTGVRVVLKPAPIPGPR